ncbi:MAG: response regulator [Gluconacetobacter diazotrophicus]|nr:response regulator [Gluconacetobacter diazotrophicus]
MLEDDPAVRSCVMELLDDGGFRCVGTSDPAEALDLLDLPRSPTLLLTDIDLGVHGLDGFEVARRARASRPALPVLFMSGRSWLLDGHPRSARDRVLPKPFRGPTLLALVSELIPQTVSA